MTGGYPWCPCSIGCEGGGGPGGGAPSWPELLGGYGPGPGPAGVAGERSWPESCEYDLFTGAGVAWPDRGLWLYCCVWYSELGSRGSCEGAAEGTRNGGPSAVLCDRGPAPRMHAPSPRQLPTDHDHDGGPSARSANIRVINRRDSYSAAASPARPTAGGFD